jgi:hypothetical protein
LIITYKIAFVKLKKLSKKCLTGVPYSIKERIQMKKLLRTGFVFAIAAVSVLVLAACGETVEPEETDGEVSVVGAYKCVQEIENEDTTITMNLELKDNGAFVFTMEAKIGGEKGATMSKGTYTVEGAEIKFSPTHGRTESGDVWGDWTEFTDAEKARAIPIEGGVYYVDGKLVAGQVFTRQTKQ